MPKSFHQLTLEQFIELLARFPFTRHIESIHMHHTWRPNREQYNGLSTLEGMWAYHTQVKGWSDIAQHLTIAPDGTLWTGRNWNQPPASAQGFNGNRSLGPFMFEIIGDFDKGKDPFEGRQKDMVIAVIAHLQKRFKLQPESLRFHNSMSNKTCPGSEIKREALLRAVAALRSPVEEQQHSVDPVNSPFPDQARGIWHIIQDLSRSTRTTFPDEGEGCDHDTAKEIEFSSTVANLPETNGTAVRGKLNPGLLRDLRPHVINLNQGYFSSSGEYQTSPADVDAIFEEHLPGWAQGQEGDKLPIVFYAHGGLTSEQSGLITASRQITWWLENGAYPIHFVWETGLLETLAQIVTPGRQRAIDWAAPSDYLIETLAHALGGVKIWGAMKASAEKASADEGGARYAASKLAEFGALPEFKDRVELHAVGHSAGAVFHSHFLPAVLEEGSSGFRSLHFLAPAVRVDTFEKQLLHLIGKNGKNKGIEQFNVFTMARDYELNDSCLGIYQKSLLYLIHYALEPERKTPILGLEESIRANSRLKSVLNLDGRKRGSGEVIWARTKASSGRSASRSVTHGGFDNDSATMESIAQRILDKQVSRFPESEERGLGVLDALKIQEPALIPFLQPLNLSGTSASPFQHEAGFPASRASQTGSGGRKRVLCVGINQYPAAPLAGCVNDARAWRETFLRLGFQDPIILLDAQATRHAILETLNELLLSSSEGDVLAFQFSGHGTQLRDLDADELDGDSPDHDEALCPVDYDKGRFIIDDDLAMLFNTIPPGVNVTVFADCCHSGSNTRLAIGNPLAASTMTPQVRKRFLVATPEMQEAHAAFRRSRQVNRGAGAARPYEKAKEVLFAACRSWEVALESQGQGHFTQRVIQLLQTGVQGMSNAAFESLILQSFGPDAGQHPELHCADALRAQPLLGSLSTAGAQPAGASAPTGREENWRIELARALENSARILRG